MKALTITQPWATLIILGLKHFETRGWSTEYRGPLAIHAAKGWTVEDQQFAAMLWQDLVLPEEWTADVLPRGAVIGEAYLQGCAPTDVATRWVTHAERSVGDWSPGRFAWELIAPKAYPMPVPVRGALGLWTWNRPAVSA